MGAITDIQWTDSTVNPIMGCTGCELYLSASALISNIDKAMSDAGLNVEGGMRPIFEKYRATYDRRMRELHARLTAETHANLIPELSGIFYKALRSSIPREEQKKQWDKDVDKWSHADKESLFTATRDWFNHAKIPIEGIDLEETLRKAHEKARTRVTVSVESIPDRLTTSSMTAVLPDVLNSVKETSGEQAGKIITHQMALGTACYASELTRRFGNSVTNPLRGTNLGLAPQFEKITQRPGQMKTAADWKDLLGTTSKQQPWKDGIPRMIFISDMGDSLARLKDFGFLRKEVLENVTSDAGRRHIWQWLTKRPGNLEQFARECSGGMLPVNLMAMTTLTCWDQENQERLVALKKVAAKMRGLSLEPLFDRIPGDSLDLEGIHWVIIGGESGDTSTVRPFEIDWALELIECCKRQNVAVFVKQLGTAPRWMGEPVVLKDEIGIIDGHGGNWDLWLRCEQLPERIREKLHVREFPSPFREYRPIPKKLLLTRPSEMKQQSIAKGDTTSPDQKERFKALDSTVRKAAKGVVEASIALAEIKNEHLYKAGGHHDFEGYCREVHNMSKAYAYSLMASGRTYLRLSTIVESKGLSVDQLPRVESQLRELSRVKDLEQQCTILAEVIEEKGADYTAADISEKVDRIRAISRKKRKDTPKQRLEKVREDFGRLKEIVAGRNFDKEEKEVVALLASLEKLLAE